MYVMDQQSTYNQIQFVTINGKLERMTEYNTLIIWHDSEGNILKRKSLRAYFRYHAAQRFNRVKENLPQLHVSSRELRHLAKLMTA